MDKYSYLSNADVSFIDDLYQKYKTDPEAVDISWQRFFEGFEFSHGKFEGNGKTKTVVKDDGISLKELGIQTVSPARISRIGPPQVCVRPQPAVTTKV